MTRLATIAKKMPLSPTALLALAQAFFLVWGIAFLHFEVTWVEALVTVATAVIAELAFTYVRERKIFFPTSAIAAGLGICLFLRSYSIWFFVLAALLAIASKYVLRAYGKHIFNPSNFAIVTLVFLFPAATTIEFTQWGSSPLVFALFTTIAISIALYARVLPTTISFLLAYTGLLAIFVAYEPALFSVHHYGLLSLTLILFSSFMITDPRTAPSGFYERILHGISVASLYFFLEGIGMRYSLFLASFLITVLNLALRPLREMLAVRLPTRTPQNSLSAALCIVLLLSIMLPMLIENSPQFPVGRISWKFLLMGLESPELLTCKKDPPFVPVSGIGLTSDDTVTSGAAWGDYDNDGYDDLFTSSPIGKDHLFHNDGDGTFTDVSADAGLSALRSSSAFFADYDNDGKLDLFLTYPPDPSKKIAPEPKLGPGFLKTLLEPDHSPALRVYRNVGQGKFVDVTRALGLDGLTVDGESAATMSFADYNNDGYLDFVMTTRGRGRSINVTRADWAMEKSVVDPFFELSFTFACDEPTVRNSFASFVSNGWVTQEDVDTYIREKGCIMPQPTLPLNRFRIHTKTAPFEQNAEFILNIPGAAYLFENKSGKRFAEHSDFNEQILSKLPKHEVILSKAAHPFDAISGRFYQPISFDYNDDGKPDILIVLDRGTSILLRNDGDMHFTDMTGTSGIDYADTGMGGSVADYDHDGKPDIFITNGTGDSLFKNVGGTYVRQSQDIDHVGIGWGNSFLDYDLDGWDDIFIGNGDLQKTIMKPVDQVMRPLYRTDSLYRNEGGIFKDVTWDDMCPSAQSALPLAVSDYDNNGTPDVFVGNLPLPSTNLQVQNELYKNQTSGRHYVKVRLHGRVSNASGVGARVVVTGNGMTQTKFVTLGESFYSQNSLALLFGLGTSSAPVRVEVYWPSGRKTVRENMKVDEILTLNE